MKRKVRKTLSDYKSTARKEAGAGEAGNRKPCGVGRRVFGVSGNVGRVDVRTYGRKPTSRKLYNSLDHA